METHANNPFPSENVKQTVKKKYMVSSVLKVECPYSEVHSKSVEEQEFKSTALKNSVPMLCNISKRHISVRLEVRH